MSINTRIDIWAQSCLSVPPSWVSYGWGAQTSPWQLWSPRTRTDHTPSEREMLLAQYVARYQGILPQLLPGSWSQSTQGENFSWQHNCFTTLRDFGYWFHRPGESWRWAREFTQAYPTLDQKANTTAHILKEKWFYMYGVPKRIQWPRQEFRRRVVKTAVQNTWHWKESHHTIPSQA